MDQNYPYKLLIDENLSRRLITTLSDWFPNTSHVSTENLGKTLDREIWNYAKEKGYCILTKDWDYNYLSALLGCPPKVIHLNCGNKTTAYILTILAFQLEAIKDFLEDPIICYLEIE
ncbi:MAG: DUF5615 family PIN-like protein [Ignavibacteriaceae bacterium]|nr:DUF5615 family PIN-like protein [Ignavibacteriaceae bacterium]